MNKFDFSHKTIIVSGAGGIGAETARLLSSYNAKIILLDICQGKIDSTLPILLGEGHTSYICDFSKVSEIESIIKQIVKEHGPLDGFVHCAGIAKVIPLKVVSANVIWDMFAVNYVSFMELIKHFAKKTNSDGGSVVCLSAINAHYPQKCMSVYAATKGALEMAVSSLAVELFEKKIRVNAVVPGPIATPMAASFSEVSGEESNIVGQQLMALGEPADIANMTAYLLSDASKFITGRKFYVDGGRL